MFTKEEDEYINGIIKIKMRRGHSNSFAMYYLYNSIFNPEEIVKFKNQILKNKK